MNLICPSGVGDFLWIHQKLHAVPNAVYWFPEDEPHRAHQAARALGCKCGYLPAISTPWVWAQEGEPVIDRPGVYVVQPNSRLDSGHSLLHWYPERAAYGQLALHESSESFLNLVYRPKYVLAFTCHSGYMDGNLLPAVWGRIFRHIEQTIAPVRFCGAMDDVGFMQEIEQYYKPSFKPLYDEPIETVCRAAVESLAMVGVASGPLIAAQYCGAATLSAYPRHLGRMPGTWELDGPRTGACMIDELEEAIRLGGLADVCYGDGRGKREDCGPDLSDLRSVGRIPCSEV